MSCMDACCGVDSLVADSLEEIRLNLPDSVGSGLINRQLKRSIKDFCIQSEIWRYVFELVQVSTGESVYQIPEQDEAKVVRVDKLFYQDDPERRITERRDVDRSAGNHGQYWYESEPGLLVLNHPACADRVLRANVVLRPADSSERMPLEIYERWKEGIEAGAMKRVFLMPGKDWTDYDAANVRGQEYMVAIRQAKQRHLHNLKVGRAVFQHSSPMR